MSGAPKCEWRFLISGEPCQADASFRVSRGHRKHDAQDSCRRHLAATVDALAEGQACDVVVRLVHAPLPEGIPR